MLPHLCCPLYTSLAEDAAATDVMCCGMYVKHGGEVPGTPWRSHWAPRSGDPGGLLQSWGLWDKDGLSDQMKPPRTGHCGQQDDVCLLWRQLCPQQGGRPELLSSSQIFFLYSVTIFFSSEHALVCIFCQSDSWEPVTQKTVKWVTLIAHKLWACETTESLIGLSVLQLHFACRVGVSVFAVLSSLSLCMFVVSQAPQSKGCISCLPNLSSKNAQYHPYCLSRELPTRDCSLLNLSTD